GLAPPQPLPGGVNKRRVGVERLADRETRAIRIGRGLERHVPGNFYPDVAPGDRIRPGRGIIASRTGTALTGEDANAGRASPRQYISAHANSPIARRDRHVRVATWHDPTRATIRK